jgi:hypothetical protein
MSRRKKILVGAALPAMLAIGVVTGLAFAQMPGGDHHRDDGGMGMHQAMQSGAMQDHMKEVLGEDGYAQMLEAMATHDAEMPMGMANMDGMMQAMAACLGNQDMLPAQVPAGDQHSQHHPGPGA